MNLQTLIGIEELLEDFTRKLYKISGNINPIKEIQLSEDLYEKLTVELKNKYKARPAQFLTDNDYHGYPKIIEFWGSTGRIKITKSVS